MNVSMRSNLIVERLEGGVVFVNAGNLGCSHERTCSFPVFYKRKGLPMNRCVSPQSWEGAISSPVLQREKLSLEE